MGLSTAPTSAATTSVLEVLRSGNVELAGSELRGALSSHLRRVSSVCVDGAGRKALARTFGASAVRVGLAIDQLAWAGVAVLDGDVLRLPGGNRQ